MSIRKSTVSHLPVACFAPPMSDELFASYEAEISSLSNVEIKEALTTCLACVKAWWAAPDSTEEGVKWDITHQGKAHSFKEIPLSEDLIKALWDTTPWPSELKRFSNEMGTGLFDTLSGKIRDIAFHLLWHCNELSIDREPLTVDKL